MDNILSALSLILGMFVAIFIKWLEEITKANEVEIPTYKEDGENEYKLVKKINWVNVFPLLMFSLILTLVIIPDWLKILFKSLEIIKEYSFNLKYYDIVSAIYLLIGVTSFSFTVYLSVCFIKLLFKTKKLNPKNN